MSIIVDYGHTKITQHTLKVKLKVLSLQNVEVGHYVEEEGCASKSNGHLSGLGEGCGLQ